MTARRLGARLRSLRPGAVTLGAVASTLADLYGDRVALVEGATRYSYADLARMVDDRAGGLAQAGMPAGMPVAVIARNGVPLFTAVLAVARAGGIPVPLNPQLREHEVEAIVDETGAVAVVVDATTRDVMPHAFDLDALPPAPPPALPKGKPGDVAAIFATSGTTGRSKGAELTHRGLLGTSLAGAASGGLLSWTVLEALPVSHIMGFSALAGSIAAGLRVAVCERFHPVEFLETAAELKPEVVIAVPTMYRMLLEARGGPLPEEALRSVRVFVCGSDVLPKDVARRLRRLGGPGAVLVEGYGMVELSGAATVRMHLPLVGPVPPGDLGVPVPPYRVRIVNDRGWRLPPFHVGHLEVKGPGVLAGYINRPEATADAVRRGGWLRTGDLASWGPFGLRFAGRERDMVKIGGYSVYPREVEDELRACPGVGDVACVGLPDAVKGEVLACAAEPAEGMDLTEDQIDAFARSELADYRRPARYLIVNALPRNPNRKVVKERVKELFRLTG